MNLQERMHQAKSGKTACNIYLGKHCAGSGIGYFVNSASLFARIESVFHFGLSLSLWIKKEISRALFLMGFLFNFC